MTPVVAVTGTNGFVGHHVAREFAQSGYHVVGIGREPRVSPGLEGVVDEYISCDLSSEWPTVDRIDTVVHLAGLAAVGASFHHPQLYIETNSRIVTNIGEHYLGRPEEERPRIIAVSSGAVYGGAVEGPVVETTPLEISSPYVVSKVLVENQLAYYSRRGLESVVARPFNHIGPGQGPGFIVPDLIASLRASMATGAPFTSGNLSTVRDYTDVRDVAHAYRLLADAPVLESSIYNICSGVGRSGAELLALLVSEMAAEGVATDAILGTNLRPTDASVIVGDSSRVAAELGWTRRYDLRDSLRDAVAR